MPSSTVSPEEAAPEAAPTKKPWIPRRVLNDKQVDLKTDSGLQQRMRYLLILTMALDVAAPMFMQVAVPELCVAVMGSACEGSRAIIFSVR